MADADDGAVGQGGFTLLELLVVITILGLIMAALTSGVQFAGRAWETQERQMDREADLNAVQNLLWQLVGTAKSFESDGTSLKFVAAMPRALARGGLYDIELLAFDHRLLLRWQPHFGGPTAAEPGEAELARQVDHLDLAFYFAQPNSAAQWSPVAKDKAKPPSLIKLTLQMENGANWPPLIVPPMLDAPP